MIDVDLPSLTTINSGGNNFCHPRSVTLESNYNYYVKLFKDIPNLESARINNSAFNHIRLLSISSMVA